MSDETKVGRITFAPSDPKREGQCRAVGDHAMAPGLGGALFEQLKSTAGFMLGEAAKDKELADLRTELAAVRAENVELRALRDMVLAIPRGPNQAIWFDDILAIIAQAEALAKCAPTSASRIP